MSPREVADRFSFGADILGIDKSAGRQALEEWENWSDPWGIIALCMVMTEWPEDVRLQLNQIFEQEHARRWRSLHRSTEALVELRQLRKLAENADVVKALESLIFQHEDLVHFHAAWLCG